jgi:endonuclease G
MKCPEVEAVERAAGLIFFADAVKSASTHICKTTKCQVVVRRFDEARKKVNRKTISAPK